MRERFSDFWLSDNTKDKLEEGEELSAIELAQAKRSIADFVRIMTRQDIPVEYQEEGNDQSYTDGEVVTISPEVSKDGGGFDATVGVALHEASHIVKSDFDMLEKFQDDPCPLVSDEMVEAFEELVEKSDKWQELQEMLDQSPADVDLDEQDISPEEQAKNALHHIWNVVEDRWIDQWAYSVAPGYRGYYQKMYKRYWHSDDIAEAFCYDDKREEIVDRLRNANTGNLFSTGETVLDIIDDEIDDAPEQFAKMMKAARERLSSSDDTEEVKEDLIKKIAIRPTWNEYSYRVTNITNDSWNPDALPGLRKIHDILDVANIQRHKSSQDCLETAKEILWVILENAESMYVDPAFGVGSGDGDGESVPYEDFPEELQDALEDQLDQMQGNAGGELDEEMADKVESLEEAGIDEKEVGQSVGDGADRVSGGSDARPKSNSAASAGVRCVVIESISQGMIEKRQQVRIIRTSVDRQSKRAVQRGIEKGRVLGNRLKIRDERRETKFTRRRNGKLDSRLLAEIGHSSRLFYNLDIEEYKNGVIHISVDASGSMGGDKFEEAMQTCVAIAQAAQMIENIRAQISFRSTTNVGSETRPLIVVGYDSRRDTMATIKQFFPYMRASGTTPEGLCFEAIQDKILPSSQTRESYFVNLSDGKPNFRNNRGSGFGYGGNAALEHTARQIDKMRKKGVQILSYYIGGNSRDQDFRQMYKNDSRFIDVNDITGIKRTLNEKFLEQDSKVSA